MVDQNKILVICGPTATGKTKLALELAQKYNGELVSADSRQVYRGMDIITGKDIENSNIKIQISKINSKFKNLKLESKYIGKIPIWMIDVCNPDYRFNVSEYVKLTKRVIDDILSRGKLPVVVGGTGFYLRGLFGEIDTIGIPPNEKLREKLGKLSVADLQYELVQQSPELVEGLNESDRNNPRRLIRAIEILMYNKQKVPPQRDPASGGTINPNHDILWLGLTADLSTIKQRIVDRINDRLIAGAEKEIQGLLDHGYGWENSRLGDTIGYFQWRGCFTGNGTREKAITDWTHAEIAYAKRQLTWFKKEKRITWFDINNKEKQKAIFTVVKKWYTSLDAKEN